MLALFRCCNGNWVSDALSPAALLTRKNAYAKIILQRQYRVRSICPDSGSMICSFSTSQSTSENDSFPSILTLDRDKLQTKAQRICDISLRKTVFLRFRNQNISGPSSVQFRFQATKDDNHVTQDIVFPPHTRGVFYYHVDPQLPPISGEIRFRLCDSPATFDQGQDLQISPRKPWKIPLLRIAHKKGFQKLSLFLMEEGLVQKDLLKDLAQLKVPSKNVGLCLYDLSQPLVIDLEATAFMIHLVTRKTFSSTLFFNPFYNSHRACSPYSGASSTSVDKARLRFTATFLGLVKARFELSKMREHKEKGPTLVLRILEFLSPAQRILPLDTGPYIELVPNTFAMRRTVGGHLKSWAYPVFDRTDGAKWQEFLGARDMLN